MTYNLSVIIPTYREENRIERCIKESLFFLRQNKNINNFEIIFVADDSGDNTIPLIRKFEKNNKEIKLIANKQRLQKGFSVRKGILSSKHDIVMFYDADLSTPLYEIDNFLNHISKYDILIGSRGLKDSKVEKKWFKIFLSRGFSLLKKLLLNIDFKDTQCGFKMFRKNCKIIFKNQTIQSDAFDVEILYLAKQMKFKIKELPITWVDSDMSNFRTSGVILRFFKELIKIKLNSLKGTYKVRLHGR